MICHTLVASQIINIKYTTAAQILHSTALNNILTLFVLKAE